MKLNIRIVVQYQNEKSETPLPIQVVLHPKRCAATPQELEVSPVDCLIIIVTAFAEASADDDRASVSLVDEKSGWLLSVSETSS